MLITMVFLDWDKNKNATVSGNYNYLVQQHPSLCLSHYKSSVYDSL
jgi:hypothetical protein